MPNFCAVGQSRASVQKLDIHPIHPEALIDMKGGLTLLLLNGENDWRII